MRQRTRAALVIAALIVAGICGRAIDVPALAGDQKGDEATYILMASSLARDHDLAYTRADYLRFREYYGHGPEGIFLKYEMPRTLEARRQPIPSSERLAFGKPLLYAVFAAPFVWLGGLGGLVIFNWVLIALCAWCGWVFGRAQAGWPGAVIGVAFVLLSDVWIFSAWFTTDLLNFALVFVAYFLWLYKKAAPVDRRGPLSGAWTDWAAAVLLGLATYQKPPHVVLMGPLGLDLLLARRWRMLAALIVAFVAGSGGGFAANWLTTGETNYQGTTLPASEGAGRRTFYGQFPFDDAGTPFEGHGNGMVTNDADTDLISQQSVLAMFPRNVEYFFIGRHAGFVPYYFAAALVLALWVRRLRAAPLWQWTTALTFLAAIAGMLILAPYTWNGAGGPPGNRYIVAIAAVALFLLPRAVGPAAGLLSVAGSLFFIGPMLIHPFVASSKTYLNTERAPLRWLPIELSLIKDLPVVLNAERGPIMYLESPTVFLYYLDGHTYSAEPDGTWIAGDAVADIIVRSERPLARLDLSFKAPIENDVTVSFAGARDAFAYPGHDEPHRVSLVPQTAFRYQQSYAYVLHMTTTRGFVPAATGAPDTRNLGIKFTPSFVFR